MIGSFEHPLRPIVTGWVKAIQLGMDAKKKRFQPDADEAMRFLTGPYNWLYEGSNTDRHFRTPDMDQDPEAPSFQMTLNKAAELVQLFGPSLYHRNPTRRVRPRKQPVIPPEALGLNLQDPQQAMFYQQVLATLSNGRVIDQQRAALIEAYLNSTPEALGLKADARWGVDEGVLKGMGLLWTDVYVSPGSATKMVGSFFDSVDNFVIDPDATSLRNAKWVARRCLQPVWEVERRFGLPPGSIPATHESVNAQATNAAEQRTDYERRLGLTNDLIEYWLVYSKMGLGGRLRGLHTALRGPLEIYGDYCFLAVASGVPYPLNLPPPVQSHPDQTVAKRRTWWPTPFWMDGGWPCSPLAFHEIPRDPWPLSHLAPGMGELKFLNWAFSFLAGKVRMTSRDFLAIRKDVVDDFRRTVLNGQDLSLLEFTADQPIDAIMKFLQHPGMNADILKVIALVSDNFDRRVGLTELMYGQSTSQLRSAAEADLKAGQLNIRPDDMANKVEDWMSVVARKEALAARYHLRSADVQPLLGDAAAGFWDQAVVAATAPEIIHGLDTSVESGSTAKPTPEADVKNLNTAMTTLFAPLLQAGMQLGDLGPANALLSDWADSLNIDGEKYTLKLPPPQPALPTPAGATQAHGAA